MKNDIFVNGLKKSFDAKILRILIAIIPLNIEQSIAFSFAKSSHGIVIDSE